MCRNLAVWMASVSVLPVVFFVLVAEGTIQSPKGVVYFPPYGLPGKTVTCSTNVSANITWIVIVNGKEISLDPIRFNITKVNATTSVMYLTSEFVFSTLETRGTFFGTTFFCKTETNETSDRFQFKQGALQIPAAGNPSSLRVSEGQDACFTCSWAPQGNVLPQASEVSWIRNSAVEVFKKDITDQGVLRNELCFRMVKRSQAGKYQCVVKNEFGAVNSSVAELIVKYGIVPSGIPTQRCFKVGKNVAINVTVFGVRPEIKTHFSPTVEWINDTSGTNGTHHVKYTFIAPESQHVNVTVIAKTALNVDTLTRSILVYDPDSQVNVSVMPIRMECTNVGLAIQWTVSGNSINQIHTYILKWRRHTGEPVHTWNNRTLLVSNHTSLTQQGGNATLEGLEQGERYTVEVEAVSECVSLFSENISATTLTVSAPDRPVLYSLVNPNPPLATNHSLRLNWTVGHNGGDNISDYTVIWSTDNDFSEEHTMNRMLSVSENCSLTQQGGICTLENLAAGTAYYIKIRAKNCFGNSISSPQTLCTLCVPPSPSAPQNITVLRRYYITFTVKAPNLGCGKMANYVVTAGGIRNLEYEFSENNETITFTITNLTKPGQHRLRVLQIVRLEEDSCFWTSLPSGVGNVSIEVNLNVQESDLKTGEIVAIVLGCVVFVVIGVAITIICVKRILRKGTGGEENKIKAETEGDNKADGDRIKEQEVKDKTDNGDNTTSSGTNKERPTAIGIQAEKQRPLQGLPMNKVVSSEMDSRASQELQKSEKSLGMSGTIMQEPNYMQPQFVREENRPPQRVPGKKVTYARLDPKATRKLQEELKTNNIPGINLLNDDDDDDDDGVVVPAVNTSLV